MTDLRLILSDHLSPGLSSLRDVDREHDVLLIIEAWDEATYVPHHKQKLILILSAMRHFAAALAEGGFHVDYVFLDDPANTGSLTGEVHRALLRHRADRVVVTEPGEWRLWETIRSWKEESGVPVEVREDDRFLCSRADFLRWAEGRQHPRQEHFYREMRRRTGLLMSEGKPEGDRWNFDAQNRRRLPADVVVPPSLRFSPDPITQQVIALVEREFGSHFGDAGPFGWAVTHAEARAALRHFLEYGLPAFGDYQDAMGREDDFLFHSALSPYLNLGLLTPSEVCREAVAAGGDDRVHLNSLEGFIRQIVGWREYVRGIYWAHMPTYKETVFLEAQRPLPAFYWTGRTDMECLRKCIEATRRNAYAHHIQRLMVTGNFALLAGIIPREVEEWYLLVYADAFEWVELPNTHGMALFADGGLLGSKPYAASGAYIDRMSDYCGRCPYEVKLKSGPRACPFNYLYWDFLMRNREKLERNPRMGMSYRTLAGMGEDRRRQTVADAHAFLQALM